MTPPPRYYSLLQVVSWHNKTHHNHLKRNATKHIFLANHLQKQKQITKFAPTYINHTKQHMFTQKEQKDKEKTRREELAKFLYDLAKTTFAVMVAGNVVGIFAERQDITKIIILLILGLTTTFILAALGDRTLKR